MAATDPKHKTLRVGASILIRRTDGSNRVYKATCTEADGHGLGLMAEAVLAVGEVVEVLAAHKHEKPRRARILYRTANLYGLDWVNSPTEETAPQPPGPERLAVARQLLENLKVAYHSLSLKERAAVRRALCERISPAAA